MNIFQTLILQKTQCLPCTLSDPTSSPRPSYQSQAHTQGVWRMGYSEPATYFRCSDGTDAFQAFPLGKLGCSYSLRTVHVFHTVCGHRTRARHGEMAFSKCRHMCFSPSVPYFSGLVLRPTLCSDIGMFSASLNLQTCTLLGNL